MASLRHTSRALSRDERAPIAPGGLGGRRRDRPRALFGSSPCAHREGPSPPARGAASSYAARSAAADEKPRYRRATTPRPGVQSTTTLRGASTARAAHVVAIAAGTQRGIEVSCSRLGCARVAVVVGAIDTGPGAGVPRLTHIHATARPTTRTRPERETRPRELGAGGEESTTGRRTRRAAAEAPGAARGVAPADRRPHRRPALRLRRDAGRCRDRRAARAHRLRRRRRSSPCRPPLPPRSHLHLDTSCHYLPMCHRVRSCTAATGSCSSPYCSARRSRRSSRCSASMGSTGSPCRATHRSTGCSTRRPKISSPRPHGSRGSRSRGGCSRQPFCHSPDGRCPGGAGCAPSTR